jgi:hypothetical protein
MLLAVLIAKLLDPIAGILGLFAGWFCRMWWQTLGAAIIIAGLVEAFLHQTQWTRHFDLTVFVAASPRRCGSDWDA